MTTQGHEPLKERISALKEYASQNRVQWAIASNIIDDLQTERDELAAKLAEANEGLRYYLHDSKEEYKIWIHRLLNDCGQVAEDILSRTSAPKPGE